MENLEDSYRAKGLRRQLIKELRGKGIENEAVLDVMMQIPRHFFFDSIFLEHAYEDKAFPIGQGQTISQPYTVAFQTCLLPLHAGAKILEIGTGSGYQSAILVALGVEVFTIEYNQVLFEKTRAFLPKIGFKPHFFQGDGSKGLAKYAPFDGIVVTAGAPTVPTSLIRQLKDSGILVIPVGNRKSQQMMKITRVSENKIVKKTYNQFAFVPLLGDEGWKK